MAVSFKTSGTVNTSAESLLQAMMDTTIQEEVSRHFGAVKASCTRTDPEDDRVIIEIMLEEKSMTGAKTERSMLYMEWNTKTMICEWLRDDLKHRSRVKVSGQAQIKAVNANQCIYYMTGIIDIRIPIIGKMIAVKVAVALEDKHVETCEYWSKVTA